MYPRFISYSSLANSSTSEMRVNQTRCMKNWWTKRIFELVTMNSRYSSDENSNGYTCLVCARARRVDANENKRESTEFKPFSETERIQRICESDITTGNERRSGYFVFYMRRSFERDGWEGEESDWMRRPCRENLDKTVTERRATGGLTNIRSCLDHWNNYWIMANGSGDPSSSIRTNTRMFYAVIAILREKKNHFFLYR